MNDQTKKSGRAKFWIALLVLVTATVAIVAIPVFVIMPFKAQTAAGVEWSYWLRRVAPWATVVAVLLALWLCFKLWPGARWDGRASLFIVLAPLGLVTWFAQQNHFEWMFNPLPNATYAAINEVNFVADNEMVMAIEHNGEAVAYPVLQMAYHHVINDVVGGKPITATY